jgi:hypothetical protein
MLDFAPALVKTMSARTTFVVRPMRLFQSRYGPSRAVNGRSPRCRAALVRAVEPGREGAIAVERGELCRWNGLPSSWGHEPTDPGSAHWSLSLERLAVVR